MYSVSFELSGIRKVAMISEDSYTQSGLEIFRTHLFFYSEYSILKVGYLLLRSLFFLFSSYLLN